MAMTLTEAYAALGYNLTAPRTDWSSSGAHGVCLSFWRDKVGVRAGQMSYDTREHQHGGRTWLADQGNRKRLKHLVLAVDQFDGWVDVVLLGGMADKRKVSDPEPWLVRDRKHHRWRVLWFDLETGDFRAEPRVWTSQKA